MTKYYVYVRNKNEWGNWLPWEYVGGDACDTIDEAEGLIDHCKKELAKIEEDYRNTQYEIREEN